jgi:hypothetical protein
MNNWDMSKRTGCWEVEGRMLLTDADVAQIRYVQRVVDCNKFDSLFVEALALRLASKINMPLNGSVSLAQALLGEYEKVTGGRARRTDAFEARPDRRPAWMYSELVRARFQQGVT